MPGVPLPLIGMVAYGVVALLGIQLGQKSNPLGIGEANGRLVLLGTSTSMAAASAYFLYILSTKFTGEFCPYCLASVLLSFGLFISSIKVTSTVVNIVCLVSMAIAMLMTKILLWFTGCGVSRSAKRLGYTVTYSSLGGFNPKQFIQYFAAYKYQVNNLYAFTHCRIILGKVCLD